MLSNKYVQAILVFLAIIGGFYLLQGMKSSELADTENPAEMISEMTEMDAMSDGEMDHSQMQMGSDAQDAIDYTGTHIMGDGSVMTGSGIVVDGAVVQTDGTIKLQDGMVITPVADYR